MKYPAFFRKLNEGLAFCCGCLVFLTGIFAVVEAVMRGLFNSPTVWTLNVSCYLLIWAIFLGSPYAFQTHGHVAVDLLRDAVDKLAPSRVPRRVMAVVGYLASLGFLFALLYAGYGLVVKAVKYSTLTTTTVPIPVVWLQLAIVIGCALMILTIVFIILDVLSGSEEYI